MKNFMSSYWMVGSLSLLFFVFMGSSSLIAAPSGGTQLSGVVLDEVSLPISGATVTVSAAGTSKSARSGGNGGFSVAVEAGTYAVHVEIRGFRPIDQPVVVVPESGLRLNFTMELLPIDETVVVSASKIQTPVIDSPTAVSVVNSNTIASSPAQNYGDLLRSVPGVSAVQLSARDVNLTSRGSASMLSDSELALVDGRSVYQDFFGFVLWDVLPIDFSEIKQVEVVRGPASAVWGANAMAGVVNVITKSPLEMLGTTITLSAGFTDRNVEGAPDTSSGGLFHASVIHAQKLNDRFSYKLSMGYFDEDPLARPVGTVPYDPQKGTGGGVYPPYQNQGTSQPKFDFQLNQELESGGTLTYSGGIGGTNGIITSGIGPFGIDNKTYMGYGKVSYNKENLKATFFANILDGDATNLLTTDASGNPIKISFKSQTYDGEFGDSAVWGTHQLFTFGGNIRRENFNLSVAPDGKNRTEGGGYIQDDIFFKNFRIVAGLRVDKFSVISDPVVSPRVTFMIKPTENHTIRLSANKAFRSPSLVENYVDLPVVSADIDLGQIDPRLQGVVFPLITTVLGNTNLKQESQNSYEIGYLGRHGGSSWGLTYYINDHYDIIDQGVTSIYTADNPPPGWPLPPFVLTLLAQQGVIFPATLTYENLGSTRSKGLEVSFDQQVNRWITANANYTWQADPDQTSGTEQLQNTLNLPAHHRFNATVNVNTSRYLGSFGIQYVSKAFWADVLGPEFHGYTDPYTMINVGFGVRWHGDRFVTSLKVTDLGNQQIQQHIFGDIIKRAFVVELKIKL